MHTFFVSLDIYRWRLGIRVRSYTLESWSQAKMSKLGALPDCNFSMYFHVFSLADVYLFLSFNLIFFGAISQTINVRDFFFFQSAYYPNLYQRPSCLQLQQWSRVGCFLMSCISEKVRFNLCVCSVSLKSVTFYHLQDHLVPFLAPVQ